MESIICPTYKERNKNRSTNEMLENESNPRVARRFAKILLEKQLDTIESYVPHATSTTLSALP